jgi:hypothetical protein
MSVYSAPAVVVILNPIIGVRTLITWNMAVAEANIQMLWMAVCQVFIAEVLKIYDATCIISSSFNVANVADKEHPCGIGQCNAGKFKAR